MTKVAILSDLHTEHSNIHLKTGNADIIAFIGDICAGPDPQQAIYWAIERSQGKPSVFIPGNHEFEGMVIDEAIDMMREACEGTNIKFLYNETYDFQDIRFIGSTLWTGFNLFDKQTVGDKRSLYDELSGTDPYCDPEELRQSVMRKCQTLVGDFRKIRKSKEKYITPSDVVAMYDVSVDFIKKELIQCRTDKVKSFVLTHFAPSKESVVKASRGDPKSAYWASDCDNLVRMANVWAHGHTHTSFDYRIGDNPNFGNVYCNARGVSFLMDLADNPDFKNPLILNSHNYKIVLDRDLRVRMKKADL